ncbi:MAG TPA: helix-turn-helix transcriptional regulator [Candidimonas sp.]|nr:helix-turn-helix transcriptional regulator [Candidimonas sp.]
MHHTAEWTTINVPEIHTLPKTVFLRSQKLGVREVFPLHSHHWHQFVYATSGTLIVTVAGSWYVITPEQAIWVPTGVPHATGAPNGAEFRNLYLADVPGLGMPEVCTPYSVNGLLRALIIELELASQRTESEGYIDKVHGLVFEQLRRLKKQEFHLPWPHTPQLHRICESLYANPADRRSLDDWGKEVGASGRTVARRFEQDVGITLREWRHKLRLFLALEWLCAGRNVTDIALDLGYASTSAFSYMFRQEMGCPPSEWRSR